MKAAIVGASGYLGAELARLLSSHELLEVASMQADQSAGTKVASMYPGLSDAYGTREFDPIDSEALGDLDVVFVAVPSGRSQTIVRELTGRVGLVVDLGADFRLKDKTAYEQWYGFVHQAPELLDEAVFGLVELNRKALVGARLIAAPGCYVTAASLGLGPLVSNGMIESKGIIIDAASGTSGGGRGPSAVFQHGAVNENFLAYGLLRHRHTPEIEQSIGAEVLFTPHLAPMTRGILATCYARPTKTTSTDALIDFLRTQYEGDRFVSVGTDPPETKATYGSNMCRITARYDERTGYVLVLSALDNLTKGGAGQAIQAANLTLGLPEDAGLSTIGFIP